MEGVVPVVVPTEEGAPEVRQGRPRHVGLGGTAGARRRGRGEADQLAAVRAAGPPPLLLRHRRHPGQAEQGCLQLRPPVLPEPQDGRDRPCGNNPLVGGPRLHLAQPGGS